jgi:proline iminopeptidase
MQWQGFSSLFTSERMVADVEEMAAWTRHEFGKDKIFVLGRH